MTTRAADDSTIRAGTISEIAGLVDSVIRRRCPPVAVIQQEVAREFGVRMLDMESSRRARVIARPRQVAMYLARELTLLSLPAIGRHFGGRDHTTVMHAIANVERLSREDAGFGDRVSRVRDALIA